MDHNFPRPAPNVVAESVDSSEVVDQVTIGNTYGEQSLNNQPVGSAALALEQHLTEASEFEALYGSQFDFLRNVAARKFRVPDEDAGTLVHDVFVTYLKRKKNIDDPKRWLLGALCHASRYYWRSHSRDLPAEDPELDRVDPASQNILDSLPNQLAAREMLECLPPRCQEVLRLRYFDGCSIQEIADRYGLKVKYTQKLVTKALRRAERAVASRRQEQAKK